MIVHDVGIYFICLRRLLSETIFVGKIPSDIELCMDFHIYILCEVFIFVDLKEMFRYPVHWPIEYSFWGNTTFYLSIYISLVSRYFYKLIVYVNYMLSHLCSLFKVAVTNPQLLRLSFFNYPYLSNIMVAMTTYLQYLPIPHFKKFILIPYLWCVNEHHKILWRLFVCRLITYITYGSPKLNKFFLTGLTPIDYWVPPKRNWKHAPLVQ